MSGAKLLRLDSIMLWEKSSRSVEQGARVSCDVIDQEALNYGLLSKHCVKLNKDWNATKYYKKSYT